MKYLIASSSPLKGKPAKLCGKTSTQDSVSENQTAFQPLKKEGGGLPGFAILPCLH